MEWIGFCSESVPAGIQKLWPSFRHEERKMMVSVMQLQTVLLKSLCFFYEAKKSIKDSLCYSKLICVQFRPNKSTYITGIADLCLCNDIKKSCLQPL